MANMPQHATTFTAVHTEFLPEVRGRRGRHKQASRAAAAQPRRRFLHLRHFPSMITAILALNYFRVGKNVIKQKRGGPMGSPASPALCSMVIAVREQGWTSTYRQLIHSHKSQQAAAAAPTTSAHDTSTTACWSYPHVSSNYLHFSNSRTQFSACLQWNWSVNQDSGFELGPQHFAVRYTRSPQLNGLTTSHPHKQPQQAQFSTAASWHDSGWHAPCALPWLQ